MHETLLLRLIVAAVDAGRADALQRRLQASLGAIGASLREAASATSDGGRYEIVFEFAAADLARRNDVLGSVGSGWTLGGDDYDFSAVWNAAEGAPVLFDPAVRWAELIHTRRD